LYPATGRPTRLWLWYQVHTGTGLQQQVLGYVVCYGWLWQQQPGCRPARPHTSTPCTQGKACMVVPRLLQQWQQVKGHRQARLCRLGTQAKQQGCMLVHRVLLHQGHRPDMPRRPGTQATHSNQVPAMAKNYSVPRPCSSVGRVPRVADHVWYQCHIA